MSDMRDKYLLMNYSKGKKNEWDNFIRTAKNPLFMFERNYMDYHSDRFEDFSMMFYKNEKLVAVMPANIKGDMVCSHGGLTFGGLIVSNDIRQVGVSRCIDEMIEYLKLNGIKTLRYKIIPHIYHKQAAEEDRYTLFQKGSHVSEVTASTAINLLAPLKFSHGRKENIKKAKRSGIIVKECFLKEEFDDFIAMESLILEKRHGVKIVHSSDELYMLFERFPQNIHLYGGFQNDSMIAGVVLYEYEEVIHTQYMAANETARKNGALDLVMDRIIEEYKTKKKWLDFGISTEDGGRYLNEGLISQKEGFGGRTLVYELWELSL